MDSDANQIQEEVTRWPDNNPAGHISSTQFFDSMDKFLQSDFWKSHMVNFLDSNCKLFDPNREDRNSDYIFAYQLKTHSDFIALIKELMDVHLRNMNLEPSKLKMYLSKAQQPYQIRIVKQLKTVENFEAFKKLQQKHYLKLQNDSS